MRRQPEHYSRCPLRSGNLLAVVAVMHTGAAFLARSHMALALQRNSHVARRLLPQL